MQTDSNIENDIPEKSIKPRNLDILLEPTFPIGYYIENRDKYEDFFISALIEIQRLKKYDKSEDILLLSKTELQRMTSMSIDQITIFLAIISQDLLYNNYNQPPSDEHQNDLQSFSFIKASELDEIPVTKIKLSFGCQVLDKLFGGGLSTIGITEISGESASGKTQIALQLSLQVQLPFEQGGLNGGCLYICTNTEFPMKRLNQMIQHHKDSKKIRFVDNIFIETIPSAEKLLDLLSNRIQSLLFQKTIRLIIIDSIAALFRSEYGNEKAETIEKSKLLYNLSNILRLVNEKYGILIIVINQVTDYFSNNYKTTNYQENKVDIETNVNNNNNNNNSSKELQIINNNSSKQIQPFKKRKTVVPSFQDSKQQHTPFLLSQVVNTNSDNIGTGFGNHTTTIPTLGLSWASFINTRILLSRTNSTFTIPDSNGNLSNQQLRKLKA
ncbi:AAA ATPase domain-containing protein [Tieghemostelium lacteum]|uniref:AAA ATPase domain-containing protein n=1 Tax=Tieghemostelium lacteum TaxID=361077 RepID=A0A151ZDF2_TIELA|nr:AAA ATPase domain-containing protein [Tieghemostelium lacteum]|eukprot:KYQ91914.1 AAA ATPase domain-containing protein [Tieghemostelium lacteum]